MFASTNFRLDGSLPMQQCRVFSFVTLHILIHKDRIPIRVNRNKAGRAGSGLVSFRHQLHAFCFQLPLQLADVREIVERPGVLVPARIERQRVLFEHALKETNYVIAVL